MNFDFITGIIVGAALTLFAIRQRRRSRALDHIRLEFQPQEKSMILLKAGSVSKITAQGIRKNGEPYDVSNIELGLGVGNRVGDCGVIDDGNDTFTAGSTYSELIRGGMSEGEGRLQITNDDGSTEVFTASAFFI